MAAPHCTWNKEELHAVLIVLGLNVQQAQKSVADFEHNMGTVFFWRAVSMYEWHTVFNH